MRRVSKAKRSVQVCAGKYRASAGMLPNVRRAIRSQEKLAARYRPLQLRSQFRSGQKNHVHIKGVTLTRQDPPEFLVLAISKKHAQQWARDRGLRPSGRGRCGWRYVSSIDSVIGIRHRTVAIVDGFINRNDAIDLYEALLWSTCDGTVVWENPQDDQLKRLESLRKHRARLRSATGALTELRIGVGR